MKKYRIGWWFHRVFSFVFKSEYQPEYGTVGWRIQSGQWTEEEAREYLDITNDR